MSGKRPVPSRLGALLQAYAPVAGNAGGRGVDRAALRAGLDALMLRYRTMLWLAAGMAAVVFLVEVGVALTFLAHPEVVKVVAGAMGVTVAGAIETIRRLARDLAQTNLLVVLCGELDTESLRPVVAALARRINAR